MLLGCKAPWIGLPRLGPHFPCFFHFWQSIDPGQQFTWENSNSEVNKPKNRYANVIAYDHSRVLLTSIDGEPGAQCPLALCCPVPCSPECSEPQVNTLESLCIPVGVPGSDYINANYIDGYRKQNAYIATQGPLPETMGDFWRMVWEQRTATVVMMTRLEEKSRVRGVMLGTTSCECFQGTPQRLWFSWSIVSSPR